MGPITSTTTSTEAVLLWTAAGALGLLAILVGGLGGVAIAIAALALTAAASVETLAEWFHALPTPVPARVAPTRRPGHSRAA